MAPLEVGAWLFMMNLGESAQFPREETAMLMANGELPPCRPEGKKTVSLEGQISVVICFVKLSKLSTNIALMFFSMLTFLFFVFWHAECIRRIF